MKMKYCNCGSTGLLLLRLGVASIFIYHGINKLMDMQATIAFFAMLGVGAIFAWVVAIIETVGGALMFLGIFTRYAGYLLAIVMIFSIMLVKAKMGFQAAEIDIMLFAASIAIAMLGPGKYSAHTMCKCGGKCAVCKHDGCGCKDCKCDGCDSCKTGCTGHESGSGKCDMCDSCKGGCTGHEMK